MKPPTDSSWWDLRQVEQMPFLTFSGFHNLNTELSYLNIEYFIYKNKVILSFSSILRIEIGLDRIFYDIMIRCCDLMLKTLAIKFLGSNFFSALESHFSEPIRALFWKISNLNPLTKTSHVGTDATECLFLISQISSISIKAKLTLLQS